MDSRVLEMAESVAPFRKKSLIPVTVPNGFTWSSDVCLEERTVWQVKSVCVHFCAKRRRDKEREAKLAVLKVTRNNLSPSLRRNFQISLSSLSSPRPPLYIHFLLQFMRLLKASIGVPSKKYLM